MVTPRPSHGITEDPNGYTLYHPDTIPSPQAAFDDGYRRGFKDAVQHVDAVVADLLDEQAYYLPTATLVAIRLVGKAIQDALKPETEES